MHVDSRQAQIIQNICFKPRAASIDATYCYKMFLAIRAFAPCGTYGCVLRFADITTTAMLFDHTRDLHVMGEY